MLGRALADRGYLVMSKLHHPSIILILWWGYMAPITGNPFGDTGNGSVGQSSPGSIYLTGVGISAATLHGPSSGNYQTPGNTASSLSSGTGTQSLNSSAGMYSGPGILLPSGAFEVIPNAHEMFTLVAGANFEDQIGNWDSFGWAEQHPRGGAPSPLLP